MSYENDDAVRTMIRRVTLRNLDDGDGQQGGTYGGLKSEEFKAYRPQPFGFTSNPPAGSEGIGLALGGRSDRLVVFGVETPGLRPKGREAGSTAIYDAAGNVVSLVSAETRVVHASRIVLEAGGATITLEGGKVTIAGDVQINGATLKHNAKNVGDTHTHRDVTPGPSNTGVPNP